MEEVNDQNWLKNYIKELNKGLNKIRKEKKHLEPIHYSVDILPIRDVSQFSYDRANHYLDEELSVLITELIEKFK